MSTKDHKIIHFPGPDLDKENNPPKKQTLRAFIRKYINGSFIAFVLGTFLIPVIGFVLGPYLSKNIGSTKITDTYTMPYTSAVSSTSAVNYNTPEPDNEHEKYNFACAVRACFSCSKVSLAQATDNSLNILSIEDYSEPVLNYHCLAKDNTVNFYVVNSGDGTSEPVSIELNAMLVDNDMPSDSSWIAWDKLVKPGSDTALPIKITPIDGGDGMRYYSFELSDWAFTLLQAGKNIHLNGRIESRTESLELFFGSLSLFEGRLVVSTGGAGSDDTNILNYVYIPVDTTQAGDIIPIHSTFLIQDRAAADTVLIPDRSCRLEYSLTYKIDGKELTTDSFTTTIHVPFYKDMTTINVALYMNSSGIDHYKYASNPELQEMIGHDPAQLIEDVR